MHTSSSSYINTSQNPMSEETRSTAIIMEAQQLVADEFSEFHTAWLTKLNDLFQLLLKASTTPIPLAEPELRALISSFTSHFKEYYTVKWEFARRSVFPFFCPTWLTDLENAYSWITGWRPGFAFLIVDSMRKNGQLELTSEQVGQIEWLRGSVRMEEEKAEREMERQQVAVADRKMVELARNYRQAEAGQMAEAVERVMAGLERVMRSADCVRLKTVKGVLDSLSPSQAVVFLTAACMFCIRLTQMGKIVQAQKTLRSIIT